MIDRYPIFAATALVLALTQTGSGDANSRPDAGLLHLSNSEPCTWWDFARAILDGAGYGELQIDRVTTSEFVTPAPRPGYSVLDCSRAEGLGIRLRGWREALTAYLVSADFESRTAKTRAEVEGKS